MSSFTSEPWFEPKANSKVWIVRRGFTYHIGTKCSQNKIVIRKGFETDFASVPRIFWSLIPPWGRYGKAAVLHDYLYQGGLIEGWIPVKMTCKRKQADQIFLEAMGVLGVRMWRKYPMYWAVRAFGFLAWRAKR